MNHPLLLIGAGFLAGSMNAVAGGGGYGGARLARRLPAATLRAAVIVITSAMTVAFFWRAYF